MRRAARSGPSVGKKRPPQDDKAKAGCGGLHRFFTRANDALLQDDNSRERAGLEESSLFFGRGRGSRFLAPLGMTKLICSG
jgi:hypothetical protein